MLTCFGASMHYCIRPLTRCFGAFHIILTFGLNEIWGGDLFITHRHWFALVIGNF
uniref:Uncharacterized protein n=1 Tax=Arundo donax TaxID=35708 RepID=A0A0A9G418_ARUDO